MMEEILRLLNKKDDCYTFLRKSRGTILVKYGSKLGNLVIMKTLGRIEVKVGK